MDLKKAVLGGQKCIGIWGTGHIGYSTMSHFAERGVHCVGYDLDEKKVTQINRGESPIFAMDYWLGFDAGFLYQNGMARATGNWRELIAPNVAAHFICIPTERNGEPFLKPLEDVCYKIAQGIKENSYDDPPLVIIESTLTPGTTNRVVIPLFQREGLTVGKDVLVGCAPRRDWFASSDKSIRTLHRIFGGFDGRTAAAMRQVLSIVCENLVQAPDHLHAEVVKSIENAYRHAEVALAFELSRAYPSLDMRTVLQLVGTKWNVGTFYPSFGVGGYCIPLSSRYVIQGAEHPEELTLLRQTVESCDQQPVRVARSVLERGCKRVGILGLSYTHNVKVWSQSPTLPISRYLQDLGVEVKVHDPHYTPEEIKAITGAETFQYPQDLTEFDAVLMVAGHREYRLADHQELLQRLTNCKLVLDNTDVWKDVDFRSHGIEYHVAGDAQWLNGVHVEQRAPQITSSALAAD